MVALRVAVAMLLVALVAPGAQAADLSPRVMGGTPQSGSPAVASLAVRIGSTWSQCSAAVWRPRLLITAGHCVMRPGTSTPVDEIVVFPPGATAVIYSNTGPQGAAGVPVRQWWTREGFVNGVGTAPPDDIAVIELGADLAPGAFTRLATQAELARWVTQRAGIEQVGYGLTGPGQTTDVPNGVTLPAVDLRMDGAFGSVLTTEASAGQSSCPGDSGSPAFRREGAEWLLVGPVSGGRASCIDASTSAASNGIVVAAGYLGVLNDALASAGANPIPGPPLDVVARGTSASSLTVSWTPPAIAPQAAIAYDVALSDGAIVCQTTATSCELADLTPGVYALTVRARNVDGEGDARAPTRESTLGVGPRHRLPRPWVGVEGGRRLLTFTTLRSTSSVIVRRYVLTDNRGRVICSGKPPNPYAQTLSCALPTGRGTYRARVYAVTADGRTPASPYSKPFTVR